MTTPAVLRRESMWRRWALALPRSADFCVTWFAVGLVYRWVTAEPEFKGIPNDAPRWRLRMTRRHARSIATASAKERHELYPRAAIGIAYVLVFYRFIRLEIEALSNWLDVRSSATLRDLAADVSEIASSNVVVTLLVITANVTMLVGLMAVASRVAARIAAWLHRIESLLRPFVRTVVNLEMNSRQHDRLWADHAPGLASVDESMYWIERTGSARIRRLITELGANAVGISGGRGMGKTTMLRQTVASVRTPTAQTRQAEASELRPPISLFVEAPVDYAPRDFVLDLYAQLCEAVIAADGGERYRARTPAVHFILRVARGLGRTACVVIGLAFALQSSADAQDSGSSDRTTELAALLVQLVGLNLRLPDGAQVLILLGLVGVFVALGLVGRGGSGPLARRAISELSQIRYLQTLQTERTLNVSRLGIGSAWRRARHLAQQPITMPELVRRYRAFAATVAAKPPSGYGIGLIVAIDEMDRIADPQAAENLLNQVKATFRVPGCTYLVSVSEEALAHFERRISTTRTAVDTAFDEVVWLPEFTLAESIALLDRRVSGFPPLFLALCHCLSGGVPRDLVRAARSVVDARKNAGENQLDGLLREVIRAEVAAYLRGVLRDLHPLAGSASSGSRLTPSAANNSAGAEQTMPVGLSDQWLLKLLLDDDSDVEAQVHLAASALARRGGRWASEISAVLSYYETVQQLFAGHKYVVQRAIHPPIDRQCLELVEAITSVQLNLPLSPEIAAKKLGELGRALRASTAAP